MDTFRFFLKLVYTSLKQQTTYRASLAAGLATNLFFGLLRGAVLQALYSGQETINQLSLSESWTFVGLTQAMIAVLFVFGSNDLMQVVYSGAISADMLKPVSFVLLWLGRDLGKALVNFVGRGVIFMAIFQFFYPIRLPDRLETWLSFFLSLALGWLVHFGWRLLANLTSFWTPDGRGILRLAFTISMFFSGFFMPLRLLPEWFSRLCYLTPFPATINTPVEIFLGKVEPGQLAGILAGQLAWVLVLLGASQFVFRRGVRRLVIQGG